MLITPPFPLSFAPAFDVFNKNGKEEAPSVGGSGQTWAKFLEFLEKNGATICPSSTWQKWPALIFRLTMPALPPSFLQPRSCLICTVDRAFSPIIDLQQQRETLFSWPSRGFNPVSTLRGSLYVCIFHSFQHSRRHRDFTVAESYDASSSNSDSLSMTIPPSIDRSSIPEESYLAESKWWFRLISIKKLFFLPLVSGKFIYFASLVRGKGKGGSVKKIFSRGWERRGRCVCGKSSLREINAEPGAFFLLRRERDENWKTNKLVGMPEEINERVYTRCAFDTWQE